MVLILYFSTIMGSSSLSSLWGALMTLIFLGIIAQLFFEFRGLSVEKFTKRHIYDFISVVLGALVTYFLSIDLSLGSVVAASLVAVVCALFFPAYGAPVYCGAFVGMASKAYLTNYPSVLLAGTIAGIVYMLNEGNFRGFGGKLGTIAFTGCILGGLILGADFSSSSLPGLTDGFLIIVFSVIAAVLTFYINEWLKKGPVMASGIVSLVFGLALPHLYPGMGNILALVIICASFAGMASRERFRTLTPMAFAGIVCGLGYIFSMPYLGGPGGKLGTIAFGSVLPTRV
jgi:hypothetical protein